jgi:hypothetical protein
MKNTLVRLTMSFLLPVSRTIPVGFRKNTKNEKVIKKNKKKSSKNEFTR